MSCNPPPPRDMRDPEINWLHFALEAGGVGAWDWDLEQNELVWNQPLQTMLGFAGDVKPSPEAFLERVHEEDRKAFEVAIASACDSDQDLDTEFRFRRPDGEEIWLSAIGRCFHDQTGKPVRMLGVVQNVTSRHAVQEQERVFMREIIHRMKNTLTLVSGIVTLTERQVDSVGEFARVLKSRLSTLAETSNMLVQSEHRRAELQSLVTHALQAFNLERRIRIDVPSLYLKDQAAQLIALMLHELATNAIKHGALSQSRGRVFLTIRPDGADTLHLEWREEGVEIEAAPERAGDGMEILVKAVSYLCVNQPRLEWAESGIQYVAQLKRDAVLAAEASEAEMRQGSQQHPA